MFRIFVTATIITLKITQQITLRKNILPFILGLKWGTEKGTGPKGNQHIIYLCDVEAIIQEHNEDINFDGR